MLKDIAEYIVVLQCMVVWFWNLKSLLFAFIRCTTRCHSLSFAVALCHSLSFIVTLCYPLYHSLSRVILFAATRCHSLYDSSFVVTRHSLPLVVPFIVARCTTRLSFYINDQYRRSFNKSSFAIISEIFNNKLWQIVNLIVKKNLKKYHIGQMEITYVKLKKML